MANHKSALKRARQNKERQLRNNSKKTRIKNVVKALEAATAEKSPAEVQEHMRLAQKAIAKTAAKGTIHKRTASRNISRLSRKVQVLIKAQAAG
ncbi:MAG: 30S ribosomal protein S20 [Thermodesulfobacteriota bacterium]|nr:30S ribosomal protein S20 [Thermodesulfobacteriota bacterium]